ncbi:Ger(x)C family spore germination protein [Peribacillus cavernae]|uniref:Ger(X)C family spore germination protein n=1 Tax=Peribacillus cavernae TaxID=1674310 RepID=A0A3S0W2E9_9BACI|nr:Ger(x)C family spore germination protein [Peribacillus cavernae]MDQ0220772.1 Ger(x)C family germination protein [Peribacillus cavernae]RUQ24800.1 Ger(x)C family spore germination protein [Peribacillus cavernae]
MGTNSRKVKLTFLFFLLVPLLTGCWDSREIEERAVVLAMGIDKAPNEEEEEGEIAHLKGKFPTPKEGMIKLSAQIAVPGRIPLGPQTGGGGNGEQKSVVVIHVVGHTIEDAMLNLQQEVADELFLGHLRIIVLSEEMAKNGTQRFNDYLKRNPQIRRTASFVVSKEKASKYMDASPELEPVPALYLAAMVENLVMLGKFPHSFIGLFWSILSSKGQDGYLPYLDIKEDGTIQISGLAYFRGDKMVGKTKPLEIGAYMAAIGEKTGGYGTFVEVPNTDEVVVVQPIKRRTKIKASLQNGKPHIFVKIYYESDIEEKENPDITVKTAEDIRRIEKETEKSVDQAVSELISKTQKTRSDIFGYGEHFRAKFPDYWNKNVREKENWEAIYENLSFDVKVKVNIRRAGMKAK